MKKKEFYKEQAESFRDYAGKNPNRDLLSLFNEWVESKDIYGADKHEIWRIARDFRERKTMIIRENSEEFMRLSAVLEILLHEDLKYLNRLVEKRKCLTKGDKRLQYRHAEKEDPQRSPDSPDSRSARKNSPLLDKKEMDNPAV